MFKQNAKRTAMDVYRDFGKLVAELVDLAPSPADVMEKLPAAAELPQDMAYRLAQVVAQRVIQKQQAASAAGKS